MAERPARKLPYGVLWSVFVACLVLGAGMLVAGNTATGVALLVTPAALATLLSTVYYVLERRRAARLAEAGPARQAVDAPPPPDDGASRPGP